MAVCAVFSAAVAVEAPAAVVRSSIGLALLFSQEGIHSLTNQVALCGRLDFGDALEVLKLARCKGNVCTFHLKARSAVGMAQVCGGHSSVSLAGPTSQRRRTAADCRRAVPIPCKCSGSSGSTRCHCWPEWSPRVFQKTKMLGIVYPHNGRLSTPCDSATARAGALLPSCADNAQGRPVGRRLGLGRSLRT